MIVNISQGMIFLCGIVALWMSQSPREDRRALAPFIGLVGQPFWYVVTLDAHQYAIFVLCLFYTAGWIRGINTYWPNWWNR